MSRNILTPIKFDFTTNPAFKKGTVLTLLPFNMVNVQRGWKKMLRKMIFLVKILERFEKEVSFLVLLAKRV